VPVDDLAGLACSAHHLAVKTTLDIDGDLLREAQRAAGSTSKRRVVELALKALIGYVARRRLAGLHGAIPSARSPRRRRSRIEKA
jgi:Arc/MetJ family transcription regulator